MFGDVQFLPVLTSQNTNKPYPKVWEFILTVEVLTINTIMSASGELWEITLLGGAGYVSSVCSVFHSYHDLCFKLSV